MKQRIRETAYYIQKHKNIVDLGSGKGEYYRIVDLSKKNITAVDKHDGFLRHIALNSPSVKRVIADISDTGLPEKSFDLVIMAQVIEHILDYVPAIKEAKRLCKDDGYFYIGLPTNDNEHGHVHPVWTLDDVIALSKVFGELIELKKIGGLGTWSIYIKNGG